MKAAFFTFLLLSACTGSQQRSLQWHSLSATAIKEVRASESSLADQVLVLQGSAGNARLKVTERPLNRAQAKELWKSTTSLLHSFYFERPAPYPGFVTKRAVCPEEYTPQDLLQVEDGEMVKNGLLLYSNDRFTFGVCTKDQATYQVLVATVYCNKKQLHYEVRIFEPVATTHNLKESFGALHCQ